MHYEIRYGPDLLLALRTPLVNRAAVWEAIAETFDRILGEERAAELRSRDGKIVFTLYTTVERKP